MCNCGEKLNLKPWLVSYNEFDGGKYASREKTSSVTMVTQPWHCFLSREASPSCSPLAFRVWCVDAGRRKHLGASHSTCTCYLAPIIPASPELHAEVTLPPLVGFSVPLICLPMANGQKVVISGQ